MFGDLVLHIQDIIGSRTGWDWKISSQTFILQKKTQDYIKSLLRNIHKCLIFLDIDRERAAREIWTYSTKKFIKFKPLDLIELTLSI